MFRTLRRFLKLGSRKITERHRHYGSGQEQSKVALVQALHNEQKKVAKAAASSPKESYSPNPSTPKFKTKYNAPKGLVQKRGGRSTLRKLRKQRR